MIQLPAKASLFIPQKEPFCMVENLISVSETTTVTHTAVHATNILVYDGVITEGGLLENMAQTAACGAGYANAMLGREVQTGYIGAMKKVKIVRLPRVGEELKTTIEVLTSFGEVQVVSAQVFVEETVVAFCEMSIFVKQTI